MNYVTLPFLGLIQAMSALSAPGFYGRRDAAPRVEATTKRR